MSQYCTGHVDFWYNLADIFIILLFIPYTPTTLRVIHIGLRLVDASNTAPCALSLMSFIRPSILFSDTLARISNFRLQIVLRAARRQTNLRTKHSLRATALPTPPPLSVLITSKDVAAARDWLKSFGECSIPRAAVDITFSRSSGPGGQVCPHSFAHVACSVINTANK